MVFRSRHPQSTALQFRDSTFLRKSALAVLSVIACSPLTAAEEAPSKPNILFIAVDDLKPILGCYGDKTAITPSIDRLAKEGTVFLNAQCQWPVCGPSRASIMTSLRPEATGVTDLKTSMRAKNPNILTLPQHFRNNGYATAGAGKIFDPRCVDDKKTLDAPSWSVGFAMPRGSGFKDDKRFALAPDVTDQELVDGQIATDGIELMRSLGKSDQPFFLAVGFKKPHLPFVAPKKYWDLYQREDFALAEHSGDIKNATGFALHDSPEFRAYDGIPAGGEISEPLQREAIHGYYACTSFVDAQIGRLLDELEELGLSENTTIVLWGDHGFHLGDHGMWGKHSTLEQACRVPLIVRPHRIADRSAPANQTQSQAEVKLAGALPSTNSPVESTDVFPTLCEIAGLSYPDGLSGRSLMPLISGVEESIRNGAVTVFRSKGALGYSYRTLRYRYTEYINKHNKVIEEELFDYENDPLETINHIDDPKYADVHKRLAKQLRADGQDCDRLQAMQEGGDVALSMHNPDVRTLPTAIAALKRLQAGNVRFVAGKSKHPHETRNWRSHLEEGQHPFAVILGCADSRVPPELLFDQGFGDLFVIRVAGNVVDTDVKASVEYAVHHLHTPLVMILGHTGCGAVTATVDHYADPHEQPKEVISLLSRIKPALKEKPKDSPRSEFIAKSVRDNVRHAVLKMSSVGDLRQCIANGEVRVVGAVYNMHTGQVEVLD